MAEIGIVIPARNEQDYIAATLDTLLDQVELEGGGRLLPPSSYEIVVVENGSTDVTTDVVLSKRHDTERTVTLLHSDEASAVAARAAGMRYLVSSADPPRFLISADADTRYPRTWLSWLATHLRAGADMVTCPGYMDPVLWQRCPRLTGAYTDRVGTIFFDPGTCRSLGADDSSALFSEQVYLDFGRPANAAGFAITADCYEWLGGFHREHFDEARTKEILIAALPLQFRAELSGCHVAQPRGPWWLTSPRRLVGEPDVQLGRTFQHTEMGQYRTDPHVAYERFDAMASTLDFDVLLVNCVRDYLLTPCITRPHLVASNLDRYFGAAGEELCSAIDSWHAAHPEPEPRHVFDLATHLADRHSDQILEVLTRQDGRGGARPWRATVAHAPSALGVPPAPPR